MANQEEHRDGWHDDGERAVKERPGRSVKNRTSKARLLARKQEQEIARRHASRATAGAALGLIGRLRAAKGGNKPEAVRTSELNTEAQKPVLPYSSRP